MTGNAPDAFAASSRSFFLDNLRSAIIVLVVIHHAAIVYAADTPFYYVEPGDILATIVLLVFHLLNQAWFMGALFLLAGYFTPGSFDRKGTAQFLKDRALRLGIPILIYAFIFSPTLLIYGVNSMPASVSHITKTLTWADYPRLIDWGPLWFAAMLLVFDFGYAALRRITKDRQQASRIPSAPGFVSIAVFVAVLAAASYLWRIIAPLGKSLLGFPTIAYLPQYLGLFSLGTIAARLNWFQTFSTKMGKWGFVAAALATLILFAIAITGLNPKITDGFLGNGNWPSAVYALWDSTVSVGMCLASLTFFRRFYNRPSKLGAFCAQQSYTVYIIHIPIIVILALLLRGAQAENLIKFALLAVMALPLSFGLAWLIRKIPYATRVL